jgi:hypothetical protein
LNSVLYTCYAGSLQLEPHLQPFLLLLFGDKILLFAQACLELCCDPLAFCVAGMTGTHNHTQSLVEMGSCELLAQIGLGEILLISSLK